LRPDYQVAPADGGAVTVRSAEPGTLPGAPSLVSSELSVTSRHAIAASPRRRGTYSDGPDLQTVRTSQVRHRVPGFTA